IHQIANIVLAESSGVMVDYSFSVILVLLHLLQLAELRVSETMCKYIAIVLSILREIKVFFMVFSGVVIFFSIAILHVLYGVGSHTWEEPNVNLPKSFLGAGGRYDPLANDIFENGDGNTKASYKNGPLLLMLMVYFTFSSILMLNVLIETIYAAEGVCCSLYSIYLEVQRVDGKVTVKRGSYHRPFQCSRAQATTWSQAFYHYLLFNMYPFSHVYIWSRFYNLEILDNPAIGAVIQYKCIHQITNITNPKGGVTSYFSFSVVFVFLLLLAEPRVSEAVCKHITIVFDILREVKIFFMALVTNTLYFTVAIVHAIHGVVADSGEPDNARLPSNFIGAISTGGRYDPLSNYMYEDGYGGGKGAYNNGSLLLMMMVYFTFLSILIPNVLIGE
ncbi:hypothetical protein BGW38_001790, partial [Lunasporangiospora selenospora]